MVIVTVRRGFLDLHTKLSQRHHVYRSANDTFEATEERAREIDEKLPGYITYEPVPEDAGAGLAALTVKELKALASERGVAIPKNANKDKILALLR